MTVHQETHELLTPADVVAVAAVLAEAAPETHPIAIGLNVQPTGDRERDAEAARALADAGATWWIELAPEDGGPESYRARVREGPPRA